MNSDDELGVRVTFLPSGRTVVGSRGDTILDCALDNGIDFPHECGGNCSCTTCAVFVIEGSHCLSNIEYPEVERLEELECDVTDIRLACQAIVKRGPIVIRLLD